MSPFSFAGALWRIGTGAALLLAPAAHAADIVVAGSTFPNKFYQSVNLIYPLEESGDTIT
jgi:hypothetical protein